ncbi:MAG: hypothetical protein NVSMB44_37250 [Ktedonobacteraceae bacterium]
MGYFSDAFNAASRYTSTGRAHSIADSYVHENSLLHVRKMFVIRMSYKEIFV